MPNNDVAKTITIDGQIICVYIITTKDKRSIAMIDIIDPFLAVIFLDFCADVIRLSEFTKGNNLEMYEQSSYPRECLKKQNEQK